MGTRELYEGDFHPLCLARPSPNDAAGKGREDMPVGMAMATNVGMSWVGCFKRSSGDTLGNLESLHTSEVCLERCGAHSHSYMALLDGGRCGCIKEPPNEQQLVPDADCGSVCKGEDSWEPTRYCGSTDATAVYRIKAEGPAEDKLPSHVATAKDTVAATLRPTVPAATATTATATTTSATVTGTATRTTTAPKKVGWTAGMVGTVLKGISYGPAPLKSPRQPLSGQPLPDDDFMSPDTAMLWGPKGRHDLKVMRQLGANAVRLYGNDQSLNHTPFLDEAMAQGLHVITGISDYPYTQMAGSCATTQMNCFKQVKEAYLENLRHGFLALPAKTYHPALRTVILINEPDLKFLPAMEPQLFGKALASALDAVLEAEREMGVVGPAPNFTATFSFGVCGNCKGPNKGRPALGQMEALQEAFQNPRSFGYVAKNDLWTAYHARFEHSVNTANPARGPGGFKELFLDTYDRTFRHTPVFVGEYHSPNTVDQQKDLDDIMALAEDTSTQLTGISFFEFQVRYDKGGAEMSFGMFGLGDRELGKFAIGGGAPRYSAWCLAPMQEPRTVHACGLIELGVRYDVPSDWSFKVQGVNSPELCCAKCSESPRCLSWSWQALPPGTCPGTCKLLGAAPAGPQQRPSLGPGHASGLPPAGRIAARPPGGSGAGFIAARVAKAFGGPGVDFGALCPATATVLLHVTPQQAACPTAAPSKPAAPSAVPAAVRQ